MNGFKYILGKTYTINVDDIINNSRACVYRYSAEQRFEYGFHSYLSLVTAKNTEWGGRLVKCIIPKGSWIIKGCSGQNKNTIVSNQIIIKEIL